MKSGSLLAIILATTTLAACDDLLDPQHFAPGGGFPGPQEFVSIAAGENHVCGLKESGNAYCFGDNASGQLGVVDNRGIRWPIDSTVAVAGGISFKSLTAGYSHTCGLDNDGLAWCWGYNRQMQLGLGEAKGCTLGTNCSHMTPERVVGANRFAGIFAGAVNTCGLTASGQAYCWGSGIGSTPLLKTTSLSFTTLAMGDSHVCGLTAAGAAYCWGNNYRGQLGNGNVGDLLVNVAEPALVMGGLKFLSLSAHAYQTCGITAENKAYCWGTIYERRDTTTVPVTKTVPSEIVTSQRFKSIAVGWTHVCALTDGGAAYCWGQNDAGQLGDGLTIPEPYPVPASGGLTFTRIIAGAKYSCGLATSRQLYCWGSSNGIYSLVPKARTI